MPTIQYLGHVDLASTGREDWPADDTYEDNTYVDWMKESSPKAGAHSAPKKWTVLVVMSLAVGYTAVFVDLAAVWLHDFKKGLCLSRLDGWSLLNPYLTCPADAWSDWLKVISRHDTRVARVLLDFPIYVVLVCLLVSMASVITVTRAPLVKQSGISEIKLIIAGFNYYMDEYLGAQMLMYKIAGLVLVVSSGFWLGKEGPLVHIACCILTICFERMYGKSRLEGLRRELLSAAVATGIAVAFNSPIGGVLFVVELLPSYFTPTKLMWNSFVSATIALVALYGFKVFTDGKNFEDHSLFEVLFGNFSWLFMETIPFMMLGAVGGLYGHVYTQAYLRFSSNKWKQGLWARLAAVFGTSLRNAQYLEILCVGLATALLTFPLLMTKLPLSALLKLLFTDCPAESLLAAESNSVNFMCGSSAATTAAKLAYVFVQGFVLSAYSYGLSLPGGILMPSFVLGGTLGRLVGILSQAIQNHVGAAAFATCTAKSCIVSPSSYAVVGSAAFVLGITKLTLSVVVIIFELTGAVTYVLPIMVAVMTSRLVNDHLCEENIYDAWLSHEFNVKSACGPPHVNLGKGDGLCNFGHISARFRARLPDVAIDSVMVPLARTRRFLLFPRQPYSLASLYEYLAHDNHEGYPLIASDAHPVNLGYLSKKSIYRLIVEHIGNVQEASVLLCFQAKVPAFLAAEQRAFEARVRGNTGTVYEVAVSVERPTTIVQNTASLKQVIELFERLHLNTLTINDSAGCACGFIDRFMLSRLIHLGFSELQEHLPEEGSAGHDLEDAGENDESDAHQLLRVV
ncbi:Clc chloride channel [Metschnikowia bicuspidata var. bicuspidata NRRL YB-4993]|uniref:Clc chloride channel n=1 Tax=Metschnikowia bicuspidata var. bicuspidata NRRL YB-4993 TaxID=869754 RepID=A0A1A0H8Z6_9ASCO|nr:Clc chloride channel [Metschnikowia bicuspidata var. bicuspidata NRRL YB-4993]OBA20475.1 Clc chloride channel [Metschnikowia bicuspidata var. bicuspidata NRRL YB-4993]